MLQLILICNTAARLPSRQTSTILAHCVPLPLPGPPSTKTTLYCEAIAILARVSSGAAARASGPEGAGEAVQHQNCTFNARAA